MTMKCGLGWRPDLPSHRDFRLSMRAETVKELGADLTKPSLFAPKFQEKQPVFNQEQRSNCTGQSTANLHGYERGVTPRSPAFVYYEARRKIGETDQDNGAYIRDAVAVTSELGVPRDDLWPDTDANLFLDPVAKADIDAAKRKIFKYFRVETTEEKLACLASGHPFVIGASVFSSWMTDKAEKTGWIPLPSTSENLIGGHAFVAFRREANFPATEWGKKLWSRRASTLPKPLTAVATAGAGSGGWKATSGYRRTISKTSTSRTTLGLSGKRDGKVERLHARAAEHFRKDRGGHGQVGPGKGLGKEERSA